MAKSQYENQTACTLVGLANLSHERSRLRVLGADRVAFLHGQCTNDITRLGAGESCYAAFLNAKGKMRGEGHVVCLDGAFLLETSLELQSSLEKFIVTEDVTIEDVSPTLGEWLVVGQDSVGAASPPRPDRVTFAHPLGIGVLGAPPGPVTISPEDLEILRIEAGVPLWGADMDENTIPNEAGLEARAISYDKGCYIGQETIARIKTYGHVNRRLVQLALAGTDLPGRGTKIFAEGREAGHVTSAVRSTRLGKVVALGYVRREFAMTGTKLTLNNGTAEVSRICGE